MKGGNRLREALLAVALQPRQLAQKLSQVMPGGAAQGLTVMVMDGQWLKLLQTEGRQITKLLACPIQGSSPEEIQRTFQEACAAEGLTTREILVANPTHLSTVRLFSVPSIEYKEIQDIVELQAEKHTPYAKEEIVTDFSVIAKEPSAYSRIMLVIAHQDVIQRAVQLVEASRLALGRVGCELEGLVNWYRLAKKGAITAGAALIVDVDAGATTVMIMRDGQPYFHRSLATGADHFEDDPAPTAQRVIGELHRSLETLEAEGGSVSLQEILLTGRVERLGEFKKALEGEFKVPVTAQSPWEGLTIAPECQAAYERLPNLSFASLVGLALAPSQIDLTPRALKLRHAFEARGKRLVLIGCQCVGALILASALLISRAQRQHQYYAMLQHLYDTTEPASRQVEEALTDMQFVDRRLQERGHFMELVDHLAELTLPEIQWDSLTYAEGEVLVVKGTSQKLPKVYEYVAALEGLQVFDEVAARRVTRRTVEDRDVTDFEVRCSLRSETAIP